MMILLFGVSNVGKSTIGKLLSERLCIPFYDLDDEVRHCFGITLEQFVKTGTLEDRDKKRGMLLEKILKDGQSKVVAVTPISYLKYFRQSLQKKCVFPIELRDSADHIFDRLVFSDENAQVYTDEPYKNAHKAYYMREILADQAWYGKVYSKIPNKYDMDGQSPEETVTGLIATFDLQPE